LRPEYDIAIVDQGYGGVYVHAVELWRQLRRRWRTLLIAPVDPLFEDAAEGDLLTLEGLRRGTPELSYLSYVHLVRSVVRALPLRLLLVTHRSQSLFLFDLVTQQPTVVHCDGYYDGRFRIGSETLRRTPSERILAELYWLLGNDGGDFFGFTSSPGTNLTLAEAGWTAFRGARENWCWGSSQTDALRAAIPEFAKQIRFVPPFLRDDLFKPRAVRRTRTALFTTTMHNIEQKGFPELLKALARVRDARVECIVRQPWLLPEVPTQLQPRLAIRTVAKDEMVRLYHRVWVNCRVSREESSPLSILESMLCEVPQIVSPVVAAQLPILEDGATGFIVDPDDADGFARALRSLLRDERLRDRMGRECRTRVLPYRIRERLGEFERLLA
jgi:glycosyltransferase involved in cell wall biosynthesis